MTRTAASGLPCLALALVCSAQVKDVAADWVDIVGYGDINL